VERRKNKRKASMVKLSEFASAIPGAPEDRDRRLPERIKLKTVTPDASNGILASF
jgi:hypothetical protein